MGDRQLSGRRAGFTFGALLLLVVLAVVAVVAGRGDDADDSSAATTVASTGTTAPPSDQELAARLLPPVGALGSNWIETGRDDAPSEATHDAGDACPSGPIPEGWLIRGEQRRVQGGGNDISETLSITAGIVAPGASPADLADPEVVQCLLQGLQAQLGAGSTVAAVDSPPLGPTPPGALVTHQRFQVTGSDGTGGTFDFLLVRRSRAVSLGLLTGFGVSDPTDLGDVVTVLDRPLQDVLPFLD